MKEKKQNSKYVTKEEFKIFYTTWYFALFVIFLVLAILLFESFL
jgi:hypothetical protein